MLRKTKEKLHEKVTAFGHVQTLRVSHATRNHLKLHVTL